MAEHITQQDGLKRLLSQAQVIAVVGHSDNPRRTSYQIAHFLRDVGGYRIYPVNPTLDTIDGHKSYPTLADLPEAVDIVNVFRRPEHLEGVVRQAIDAGAKAIWGQLGVADKQAAQLALEHGLDIVMDLCIKVEYLRLLR